jgi:ABC-type bacteriocin/lantibiotic exporter with double-glycine peptidase domain
MPTVSIQYSVPLIPQPNDTSCWAAAMAMVVSYRRRQSISPQRIASAVSMSLDSCYGWNVIYDAARYWQLSPIQSASYTGEGWLRLLKAAGPLWLVEIGAPSHAVVLTGGDGSSFSLNNPWPPRRGNREVKSLAQLDQDFGGALQAVGSNVQLMYVTPMLDFL